MGGTAKEDTGRFLGTPSGNYINLC